MSGAPAPRVRTLAAAVLVDGGRAFVRPCRRRPPHGRREEPGFTHAGVRPLGVLECPASAAAGAPRARASADG